MRKPDDYHSYLLRLWRVKGEGVAHWRASLERVGSDERLGFKDLAALFAYLEELVKCESDDVGRDEH